MEAIRRKFLSEAKACVVVNGDGYSNTSEEVLSKLAECSDVTVVDLSAAPGLSWAYGPMAAADSLQAHRAVFHKHGVWCPPELPAICETCQQRPTYAKNTRGHFICETCNNGGLANPPKLRREVGRNDKCFCGSGKKYKKCCLLKGH